MQDTLCFLYNAKVMRYICNKGMMDVTLCFVTYVTHMFLQMFAHQEVIEVCALQKDWFHILHVIYITNIFVLLIYYGLF